MFYNILDKKRLAILPLLKKYKTDFYLAGGTGLALHLGHRDSIDFDFFSDKDIDTKKLFADLKSNFKGHRILKAQEEKNTLTVFVDDSIKLSFFTYKYPLIDKLSKEENLNVASIIDIACMKLSAIVSRATNKDYIDLYFILHLLELSELLKKMSKKYPELDTNLILKSLVYFADIESEPISFKNKNHVSLAEVKNYLIKEVAKK
jgi:hypothetical protein